MEGNKAIVLIMLILLCNIELFGQNSMLYERFLVAICIISISIHLLLVIKYKAPKVGLYIIMSIIIFVSTYMERKGIVEIFKICFYIIIALIIITTYLYTEKIFKRKEYTSFFLETEFWKRRSENFKWNYLDLHKFPIRSSFLVMILVFGIVTFPIIALYVNNIKKLIYIYVLLDTLFTISSLAAADRRNDYLKFIQQGNNVSKVLRIIMVQFFWIISRGAGIGLIALAIISKVFPQIGICFYNVLPNIIVILILYFIMLLASNFIYIKGLFK